MYLKIKRLIDMVLSLTGLILLSPLFLLLIVLIKLDSKGPVLFKQKRVGLHKSHFHILKFRTMRIDTPKDTPTHLLENPDQWITKMGKFLRKTSLDELPQIINILKGEMSIIGPRPALWNQYDLIEERDKYGANDVPPGLTGWAQINGRDELPIEVKARLDGEYVEKIGLAMDIKCFFGTILSVLKSDGVVEGGTGVTARKEVASTKEGLFVDAGYRKESLPQVTVVVATYRREHTLEKALLSLINQTYDNIEIVVVDDNAHEEWNQKVERIVNSIRLKSTIRVNYICNSINIGSAETRNSGIRSASGDFVTFLDDDDVYLPKKVEDQVQYMIEHGADYCITDLDLYDESDKLIEKRVRTYIKHTDKDHLLKYHLRYNMTGTDSMMFKKEYLLSINGFPQIDIGDEFYLMQRAIEAGGNFGYLVGCGVKAYVHSEPNGLSSGDTKIDGEKRLYRHKKKYFSILAASDRRYIRMRHYAVMAFAEIRRKNYVDVVKYGVQSFISSPVNLTALIINRMLITTRKNM